MIKTLHILILLIFFQNLIYCQNQNDMLTVEKASKLIRKNVIVKGKVITVFYAKSSSGKPTFLNIDKDFPNNPLVVVIFEKNLKKLNLDIESYKNKIILVKGKVKLYQDENPPYEKKPSITILKKSQIQIIN